MPVCMFKFAGVVIIHNQFIVGRSATARCISDTPATLIEWLTNAGVVVESATSTQQLDLGFSQVSDSIHNQTYTCRVTRPGVDEMPLTKNFTVKVDGKVNYLHTVSS